MLSVRTSSYGCTREVWRARKMRKSSSRRSREQPLLFECSIHTVKSMGKFFYNRATTRICAKKPFIVIECKILTTHKKSKQTSLLLVRNTPRFILWFERENLSQLTDNCERKAQNLRRKWRKSKSKNSRITEKYFTSQRPEVIKTNSRNA